MREGWVWPKKDQGCWNWTNREHNLPEIICRHVTNFDTAIHAGANAGFYAKQYAKCFKRVYAVEPDPTNFYCLTLNVPESNVIKLNCALGEDGLVSMRDDENGINSGGLYVVDGDSTLSLRMDHFHGSVGLIHLDVEGLEAEVLFGGVEILIEDSPVVCLETIRAEKDKAASDYLKSHGYKVAERLPHDTIFTRV